jgi:hypothetical protein
MVRVNHRYKPALVVLLDQRGMKRGTVASTLDYLRMVADRKGISFYTHAIFGLACLLQI